MGHYLHPFTCGRWASNGPRCPLLIPLSLSASREMVLWPRQCREHWCSSRIIISLLVNQLIPHYWDWPSSASLGTSFLTIYSPVLTMNSPFWTVISPSIRVPSIHLSWPVQPVHHYPSLLTGWYYQLINLTGCDLVNNCSLSILTATIPA